jgi:hypothetical protein
VDSGEDVDDLRRRGRFDDVAGRDRRRRIRVLGAVGRGEVCSLGQRSISAQRGIYKLVERPAGAPDWVVRAQIQFSFPTGK